MTLKERYKGVIDYFSLNVPNPETELNYKNSYQLLVSVILSAQCTDKRVNLVTPALFEKYPDVLSLSQADNDDLFNIIKSISYPNSKSKHLIGMAQMVIRNFNGTIPLNVADLILLPGVGRKTANVVTSVIDSQPNMAVDTHVFRVSARIGLTKNAKSPLAAERQLIKNIPSKLVHLAHHWLILHGRYICKSQNPQCQICPISTYCKYFNSIKQKLN